jgi:hypothetical protein
MSGVWVSDPDTRRFKLLRMYCEASAVAAVGAACLVPFGCTFHVASLLSVLAGLVTMKADMATGVGFVESLYGRLLPGESRTV